MLGIDMLTEYDFIFTSLLAFLWVVVLFLASEVYESIRRKTAVHYIMMASAIVVGIVMFCWWVFVLAKITGTI